MFLGYVCEQHDNPADFFLDVICANERSAIDEGANNIYYTHDMSTIISSVTYR